MTDWGISKLTARPTLAAVLRYGLAVLLVAIALLIAVITHLHHSPPRFISHFVLLALAITFWSAGTGPGLLALLLSCLGVAALARTHFLTPDFPLGSFLVFFVVFSLLLSLFTTSRRRALQDLRQARDELEIKVAERTAELMKSERELRDLLDSIPATVWSTRPDGSNTYVNKRFVEYSGSSAEQMAGSGWQALIHPDDLERHTVKWMEAVATGKPLESEVRSRRADGQYRWQLDRGVPLRDEDGTIIKWYGVTTDIEDRKRAEHERERLRQLEAELAHVNRVSVLGEMAASLAHEIKQPIAAAITSANSCIEWLAHEPPNLDRARAAATRIDKYGNRAAEIIDRIRSFYKKSPPQRELVDMNGIIHEMLTLLEGEAARYSVAMRTELSAELPKIMADRVQLQQVLMNLMLNAIEAMKDSGGELTVKSEQQDSQLQFSVSDTGVGLPAEKVDQLFSAFFTTKPQGSGMGLAISRSIVESHGGQLWASVNSRAGATFHFTLPTDVP